MPDRSDYISSVLTHLVGRKEKSDEKRYDVLIKILEEEWITYWPHDPTQRTAKEIIIHHDKNICDGTNEMYVSSVVCFCDIPIDKLDIHAKKYSRFGLAFDKDFIASCGGGPMYYVPINAAPAWPDGNESNVKRRDVFNQRMRECANLLSDMSCDDNEWSDRAKKVTSFLNANLFAYIRGFDHKLPGKHKNNYYFEREWRIIGNLHFRMNDVINILLPEEFADKFRKDFPELSGKLKILEFANLP